MKSFIIYVSLLLSTIVNTSFQFSKNQAANFKAVTIGNKIWMAENFNIQTPKSWYYERDSVKNHQYGRLYMWSNAMAAPPGWHLPSLDEWTQLINYFGGDSVAANALLLGGRSGLNLLFCGHRSANITTSEIFDLKDQYGYYWTSTPKTGINSDQFAYAIEFRKGVPYVVKNHYRKANGFAVRFVKD